MNAFLTLTFTQIKLYIREPMAFFFTIFYAPLMLILFGSIYGNQPVAEFGGYGTVDVSVPAYVALILVSVGLMSIPIATATNRESGILRRYKATPLHPAIYMASEIVQYYLMSLAGVVLLVLVGWQGYHIQLPGNWLALFFGFSLSALSTFSMGYVLAGLSPSPRIAQTTGMVLAFPMMFLSGAVIPLQVMPDSIQHLAEFIPLTYVVKLMQGLWFGESWGAQSQSVWILLGVGIVCGAIASRTFRWE